ncbi:unnamed protein product [Cuscuta campestris]|uniref:Peptidase A1 domain-containing protein n=1 Tax=Cuscuta campestris TaxID=132261 RepID=A0A484M1Y6_9ASTE|nr:unnamed protein product [Cuscuta campestris]
MADSLSSIALFFFFVISPSSSPAAAAQVSDYHTLFLRPLPATRQSLSFTPLLQPESDETSLALELHHVDRIYGDELNATPKALFRMRLQRDAARVKALSDAAANATVSRRAGGRGADFSSSVISGLSQGSGEYFTRLGVGTPPEYLYMVLDTGSDVVWLQCSPCKKCYSQADPVFDPKKSKSFSPIRCDTPLCHLLDSPACDPLKMCRYQVSYGDGSFTDGEFSTETLTFRQTRVENVAIGCGHNNQGLFVGAAGLLGLGRGKLSFPSQAGQRFGGKFSYCLVDRSATSKPSSIVFGDSAVARRAVYTPLLKNPGLDTFYYVELLGISVGGAAVPGIKPSMFKLDPASADGGVIVDSGTSVTRLTSRAYEAMRDAFRKGATELKLDPRGYSLFDTCYDLSGKEEVKVPTVVLNFKGANVSLPASNYLIPVDSAGKFCFAFAGTNGGLSIIGNIQQQGFRVVFDMGESKVGFATGGCD